MENLCTNYQNILFEYSHLYNHNCLLHDIVDLGLNEVQQSAHASLSRHVYFDSATTDSSDRLSYKIHINLGSISTVRSIILFKHCTPLCLQLVCLMSALTYWHQSILRGGDAASSKATGPK